MLEAITKELIGEYNFRRHLTRQEGYLLSELGYKIGEPLDLWKGFTVYKLYFTCDTRGILTKLGVLKEFSKEDIENAYLGRFKIIVDQAKVDTADRTGLGMELFQEQIIDLEFYTKDVPVKIRNRIAKAASLYNGKFGFDYDYKESYDGFTAGNLLDEDTI